MDATDIQDKEKIEPEMIKEKSWKEFRESGMLWFANTILHVFGWTIVCEMDESTGEITRVYPARVRYRGFNNETNTKGYINVSRYLSENAGELLDESLE